MPRRQLILLGRLSCKIAHRLGGFIWRTRLVDELADRIFSVGDRAQAAYLAVHLGHRHGNYLGVEI